MTDVIPADAALLREVAGQLALASGKWMQHNPSHPYHRLRALADRLERFATLRDVEVRIYPDASVGVDSMTTWQRDDDAVAVIQLLLAQGG